MISKEIRFEGHFIHPCEIISEQNDLYGFLIDFLENKMVLARVLCVIFSEMPLNSVRSSLN